MRQGDLRARRATVWGALAAGSFAAGVAAGGARGTAVVVFALALAVVQGVGALASP